MLPRFLTLERDRPTTAKGVATVLALGLGLTLAVALLVLNSSSNTRRYSGPVPPALSQQDVRAKLSHGKPPLWTGACWARVLRDARPLAASCAQASGRVLRVSAAKREVLVLSQWKLLDIRLASDTGPLPGRGDWVNVIGPLVRQPDGELLMLGWQTAKQLD